MAVEYLDGDESITAARLNLLFEECNRKMVAALDGKSFYVAGGVHEDLTSKRFIFANGPRPYSSGMGDVYDHSEFEAMAAAAVEESRDEDLKIIYYSGDNLHSSLEAHARNGYYLQVAGSLFPEKHYKYVPVELIYEGIGFGNVLFPRKYNKYNCFRIHNLNNYAMFISFEGADETFTVQPLGCLCVRRDSVDSGYSAEWEYLWEARSGDPRFFVSMAPGGSATLEDFPYQHMLANNVSNPAIIHFWAAQFVQGIGNAKWHIDPHVYHDISEYYCPDYFPAPSDTTQPIGNFFHHKGEVEILGQRKTFNGYQAIGSDIPELGITNLNEETITITPEAAIEAISTNLFGQWDASKPTALGGEAYTLENANTGRTNLRLYTTGTGQVAVGDLTFNIPFLSLVGSKGGVGGEAFPSGRTFSFHRDTVDDVLKLNSWGNEDFDDTEQNTNATAIENRQLVLTPFGPRILFNHTYTFGGSFHNRDNAINPAENMYAEAESGRLVSPGYVQFDGHGWPIPGRDEDGQFFNVSYFQPAHFSPRHARAYSRYTISAGHPNVLYPMAGPNGRDIDVSSVADNYIETKYKFLAGIVLEPSSETWQTWRNPDTILSGDMPRVPLLREHYNGMAQVLNSVRRVSVLDYAFMRIAIPPETTDGEYAILQAPEPNFGGVFGTGFCPREMYQHFSKDSVAHKGFIAMGVPILTADDLPDDYQDAREAAATRTNQVISVKDKITGGSGPPPSSTWTYQGFRTFTGTHTQAVEDVALPYLGEQRNWNAEFLWVSIRDVQNAVEALGWKFTYQQTFSLHELRIYNQTPSLVYPLPGTRNFEFTRFVPSTTDPEEIIGQEFSASASFEYFSKAAVFVDSATGQWKVRQAAPTAIDTTPAGNLQPLAIAEPLPPNGSFDKYAIFFYLERPEDLLVATGHVNTAIEHYFRHCLIQNYFSDDLDNGSAAFKIPVTWARHAADDVATPSYDVAVDMHLNVNSEHYQIPLMVQARAGSTGSENIGSGETVVSFEEGKALEVVPMWKVYAGV